MRSSVSIGTKFYALMLASSGAQKISARFHSYVGSDRHHQQNETAHMDDYPNGKGVLLADFSFSATAFFETNNSQLI